jgi:hypothetical protein
LIPLFSAALHSHIRHNHCVHSIHEILEAEKEVEFEARGSGSGQNIFQPIESTMGQNTMNKTHT